MENLDDSLEKKLAGLAEMDPVSCVDMGGNAPPPAVARVLARVCPEWKVDRSGTLREKAMAPAAPDAPAPAPWPRPGGDSGRLLQEDDG